MPFVTEEIWQILLSKVSTNPEPTKTIMLAHYPTRSESYVDPSSEEDVMKIFELIGAVRNVRGELRIPSNETLQADIFSKNYSALIGDHSNSIKKLAGIDVTVLTDELNSSGSGIVALVTTGVITSLRIGDSVNLEDEFNRLQSENSDISTYIKSLEKRLSNEGFLSNAPEEVVQKEKTRLIGALERKSRLEDIIARLKS
jgi:valyl-tRNA synthetase